MMVEEIYIRCSNVHPKAVFKLYERFDDFIMCLNHKRAYVYEDMPAHEAARDAKRFLVSDDGLTVHVLLTF